MHDLEIMSKIGKNKERDRDMICLEVKQHGTSHGSLLSTAEETIPVAGITVQLTGNCCFIYVPKSAEQGKEPKEEIPEPGREDYRYCSKLMIRAC